MTIALFPGQGVQAAGMAAGIDGGLDGDSRGVFALASDVLGVDVVELCRTGRSGEADLASTRWAQPAVLVCSVIAFRRLGESFAAAAGHSVGEYAALVCADALDLADALRLVAFRARVTEEAGGATPGLMAAVMKVDRERVEEVCAQTGAALAADNSPGQYVISGAVEHVEAALRALHGMRAVARRLEVSAAFHSPVMAPARPALKTALDDLSLSPPRLEVWSSTTASPLATPDEIRRALVDQLTSPVRWRETVEACAARHGPSFLDVGPGRVVGALARRIVPGADVRFAVDALGAPA